MNLFYKRNIQLFIPVHLKTHTSTVCDYKNSRMCKQLPSWVWHRWHPNTTEMFLQLFSWPFYSRPLSQVCFLWSMLMFLEQILKKVIVLSGIAADGSCEYYGPGCTLESCSRHCNDLDLGGAYCTPTECCCTDPPRKRTIHM